MEKVIDLDDTQAHLLSDEDRSLSTTASTEANLSDDESTDVEIDNCGDSEVLSASSDMLHKLERQLRKTLAKNWTIRKDNESASKSLEANFLNNAAAQSIFKPLEVERIALEESVVKLRAEKGQLLDAVILLSEQVDETKFQVEDQQRSFEGHFWRQQHSMEDLLAQQKQFKYDIAQLIDKQSLTSMTAQRLHAILASGGDIEEEWEDRRADNAPRVQPRNFVKRATTAHNSPAAPHNEPRDFSVPIDANKTVSPMTEKNLELFTAMKDEQFYYHSPTNILSIDQQHTMSENVATGSMNDVGSI
jgi:hypothetical protein